MQIQNDKFKRRLARIIGQAALRRARPKVARFSNTLSRALELKIERIPGRRRNIQAKLHIPHYWAVYVHDGRRPFSKNKLMVWFRNPRLDPRLQKGKTPKRASQLRSLGPRGIRIARELQKAHFAAGGAKRDAPVVFTRRILKPTRAALFFANRSGGGMAGFVSQANRLGSPEFSRHVRNVMGESFKQEDTITVSI